MNRTTKVSADDVIAKIAADVLSVEHFHLEHSDATDFVEVNRGDLQRALRAAFEAGRAATR